MWDDADFWNDANKVGVICTFIGLALTFVTLIFASRINNSLKKKIRPSEICGEVKILVSDMRVCIKSWQELERLGRPDLIHEAGSRKQDVLEVMFKAKAHLLSARPNLESLQKQSVDKIVKAIAVKRTWLGGKDTLSVQQAWDIHNELHGFIVLLESLIKDREAVGL